jgi:hypothetical protein
MGTAGRSTAPAAVVRTATAPTSETLPHAWHSPQRPTHLGACHPHSEQRNAAVLRGVRREEEAAMRHTVCGPADRAATPGRIPESGARTVARATT